MHTKLHSSLCRCMLQLVCPEQCESSEVVEETALPYNAFDHAVLLVVLAANNS
jgi:hypothetical protein